MDFCYETYEDGVDENEMAALLDTEMIGCYGIPGFISFNKGLIFHFLCPELFECYITNN